MNLLEDLNYERFNEKITSGEKNVLSGIIFNVVRQKWFKVNTQKVLRNNFNHSSLLRIILGQWEKK